MDLNAILQGLSAWASSDPQRTVLAFVAGAILTAVVAEFRSRGEARRAEAATLRAEERAELRAQQERLRQARLRSIEETQRYAMASLDYALSVAIVGRAKAGPAPELGDYPKMALDLLESDQVMAFGDQLTGLADRDGKGVTFEEQNQVASLGGAIGRRLREQEERVHAGEDPIRVPRDEQDKRTKAWLAKQPRGRRIGPQDQGA